MSTKNCQITGNIYYKINGEHEMEGQYHYTLELQTCFCEPIEDGLNVYSSTQHLQIVQSAIAVMLGIPENRYINLIKQKKIL